MTQTIKFLSLALIISTHAYTSLPSALVEVTVGGAVGYAVGNKKEKAQVDVKCRIPRMVKIFNDYVDVHDIKYLKVSDDCRRIDYAAFENSYNPYRKSDTRGCAEAIAEVERVGKEINAIYDRY